VRGLKKGGVGWGGDRGGETGSWQIGKLGYLCILLQGFMGGGLGGGGGGGCGGGGGGCRGGGEVVGGPVGGVGGVCP